LGHLALRTDRTGVSSVLVSGGGFAGEHVSAVVHQATGMVAAQLNCDIAEALGRLRIRAEAMDQTLEDTALDVLDGVLRFDP
jgi:hypothetical protein